MLIMLSKRIKSALWFSNIKYFNVNWAYSSLLQLMSCVTKGMYSSSASSKLSFQKSTRKSLGTVSTYKIRLCYHNKLIDNWVHMCNTSLDGSSGGNKNRTCACGQQWCCQPSPWVGLLNFVPLSAPGAVKHLLRISWQLDVSHDKF